MSNLAYNAWVPDLGFGFGGSAAWGGQALFNMLMSDPDVVKALEATGTLPKAGPGIDAAGVEDLTPIMRSAEIKEQQLYFWREIPKLPARDLVVQWTRRDRSHGNYGATGFVSANSAGNVNDPVLARENEVVKFLAVKGQVTLPTQFVRYTTLQGVQEQGGAMVIAEENAMLTLLKLQERALFYADAAIDALEYNGVFKQIAAASTVTNNIVLDLQGAPPDRDFLEHLGEISSVNSASPNSFHIPAPVRRDLRQVMFPQQRTEEGYEGTVGFRFDRIMQEMLGGDYDTLKIRRNQMLTLGVPDGLPRDVPTTASPNAPNAPSAVSGAAGAHTATVSAPGMQAGTFYYSVVSVGEGGWSTATASGAVSPTAGQRVTLTITCTDTDVQHFIVFRNAVGVSGVSATNRKFLCRVNRSGNTTTWYDDGQWWADCSQAAYLSLRADELCWRQLMPVMKRPLPQGLMDNSFGILLFGTPEVSVPTHHIWIKNIGRRDQLGVGVVPS